MSPSQSPILLLLLGFTVTSGADDSICVFGEDGIRCVCNINGLQNPYNLYCLNAMELEVRDSSLDAEGMRGFMNLNYIPMIEINKVIFDNVAMSFTFLSGVSVNLPLSVNEVDIISSTIKDVQSVTVTLPPQPSRVTSLQLYDLTVDPALLSPSFQDLHDWLFRSLKSFSLVRSGLAEIDCDWARRAENLTHLDVSENPISYTALQNIAQCTSLSFKSLTRLHLRRTNLTSLQSLCTPLSLTPALARLDISGNNFSAFLFPACLQEKPLKMLNLSNSEIAVLNSLLSASLEELDLSNNYLELFSNLPQTLRRLYLSNNHLTRLPSLDNLSHLEELRVDGNLLAVLIHEAGVGVGALERLDVLFAGRNPYHCDCALNETIVFLDSTAGVFVEDYPEEFVCAAPEAQQGAKIMNFSVEACVKLSSGTHRHHVSPRSVALTVGLSGLIHFLLAADSSRIFI